MVPGSSCLREGLRPLGISSPRTKRSGRVMPRLAARAIRLRVLFASVNARYIRRGERGLPEETARGLPANEG